MANKSKQKGNRFEYLIKNMVEDLGIFVQRAWGSDGRSLGWHEEVDLLIDRKIKVQAKCRKQIAKWMIPSAEVDVQIIKEDRGIPYVVMPIEVYLDLLVKSNTVSLNDVPEARYKRSITKKSKG